MSMCKMISSWVMAACVAASPLVAGAQTWPSRPLTLVVPYAAGGVTDVVARMVATPLARELGQPVVVENVTGAGGNVAASKVAAAPADGYTLLLAQTSLVTNPLLDKAFKLDASAAFTHVSYVGGLPLWLLVNPAKTPHQSLAQLVQQLRQTPGKLNYGSGGTGSASHLGVAYFEKLEKLQAQHIPYRGMSTALNDLMAGSVDFAFTPVTGTESLVQSGKLKALAITGPARLKDFAGVPTFTDAGYPRMDVMGWIGISGPKDMPPAVTARLNAAINKLVAEPQMRSALLERSLLANAMTPDQFTAYVRRETARWQPLIESSGIKLE